MTVEKFSVYNVYIPKPYDILDQHLIDKHNGASEKLIFFYCKEYSMVKTKVRTLAF